MSDLSRRIISICISMILILCVLPQGIYADEEDDVATVRVYFSISDDSEFLVGKDDDSRVMARVPIDVPYVDLAEYGLESYYRYEAKPFEEGGQYKNDVLVEQPTLLMCFIKALSQYYLCRDFRASDVGTQALQTSGGATSLYLLYYWGHFYNFMYFVNHQYPLMAPGWGSTADYILLEDGDEIDVGMFTDTRFNQYGGFAYFDQGNVSLTAGNSLDLTLYLTKSKESGGSDYNGPMYKEPIRISKDYGRTWQTNVCTTDKQGAFTVPFDEAGVYYISGGPKFKNQPYSSLQCITPPICVVEVKPAPVTDCFYEPTDSGIKVSWNASQGAEGYEIRYVDKEGKEKTVRQEDTEITLADADTDEINVTVTPYVADKYVAMGEAEKELTGSAVYAILNYRAILVDEISAYPDYSLYREEEQEEIHGIVDQAVLDIGACSSESEAAAVVSEAKNAIDQIKTKAQYEAEEDAERIRAELEAAKASAVSEIENYKDPSLYRDAEKEELAQAVTEEKGKINSAGTVSEVEALLSAAKIRLDLIKTAAQYEQEEQEQQEQQERELAESKTWAKSELLTYMNEKDLTLYRDNEKRELAEKLESGIASIDEAVDQAGVSEALAAAKLEMDAVKTDAELTQEELEKAKDDAVMELVSYKDPAAYRDTEKEELLAIISEEQEKIRSAESTDKVAEILTEAKARLDAVKTDAELTREEEDARELQKAKDSALNKLSLYRAPSEYREAEKALLLEILAEGEAAIDTAETVGAVKALLTEYKGKIDQLKTIAQYETEEEAARQEETERKAREKAAAIKKAKAGKTTVSVKTLTKHKAKVTWKKVTLSYTVDGKKYTRAVTGYKIYRATKKNGKYKLIKTVKKTGTLKYTDKKLKRGKKYFYKVRTYTKIDGGTYLGKWSKVKRITAK